MSIELIRKCAPKFLSEWRECTEIINELKFQEETYKRFTNKYGGKVFHIISVKEGKKKLIYNLEVIDEIRDEIEKLHREQ